MTMLNHHRIIEGAGSKPVCGVCDNAGGTRRSGCTYAGTLEEQVVRFWGVFPQGMGCETMLPVSLTSLCFPEGDVYWSGKSHGRNPLEADSTRKARGCNRHGQGKARGGSASFFFFSLYLCYYVLGGLMIAMSFDGWIDAATMHAW